MKVLIIGVNGFVGSNAARIFSASGWRVYGADVQISSAYPIAHYARLNSTATTFDFLFSDSQFELCLNASGSANVGFSFQSPDLDYDLNVLNVQRILSAIRRLQPKCKFINFSSAAVYGNPKYLPIDEGAATRPLSPYGFHKLQSEYLLQEYHKFFGLHTCSLRVFSAYGPGLKKQLFWDIYTRLLDCKGVITLFGTGEESRDFIYIDDLVALTLLATKTADFEGEVYNAGSGQETRIKDAVSIFFDAYGSNSSFAFSGEIKIGDPINWRADISKVGKLGFVPKTDLYVGLQSYISWLKELK